MIGERIKIARGASGYSMKSLGNEIGVSANMIKKYELNESVPTSSRLLQLSRALNVRSEYFFRPLTVQLKGIEYRKRASTPAKVLRKVQADVLDQAERWQELINLWPDFPVKAFSMPEGLPKKVSGLKQIDALAASVRDQWDLGLNPIPDLIAELEKQGLLVIVTDVAENAGIDGLQASVAGQPVLVVSSHVSGDRQRFTLAHELGHLLLNNRLADDVDEERACDRFASALLLPAPSVRQHLGAKRRDIEPRELFALKHAFGLSMQACLYRAADLEVVTEDTRQRLFIQFSKQGWRKKEPGKPYPAESTRRFEQLVFRALGEHLLSEAKAAELLGISKMDLRRARRLESPDAVVSQ